MAIIFTADGEEPETRIEPNGDRAAIAAVVMIAHRGELRDGDKLSVSFTMRRSHG